MWRPQCLFRSYICIPHLKIKFINTTDEVEERVDTAGDLQEDESSSAGDSDESSSGGGSDEEETDLRVQQEVGELVKAF